MDTIANGVVLVAGTVVAVDRIGDGLGRQAVQVVVAVDGRAAIELIDSGAPAGRVQGVGVLLGQGAGAVRS